MILMIRVDFRIFDVMFASKTWGDWLLMNQSSCALYDVDFKACTDCVFNT